MVRLSGEELVKELLKHLRRESSRAFATIVGELLKFEHAGQAEEGNCKWKLVEVALFIFGHAARELCTRSLLEGDMAPIMPIAFASLGRLCTKSTTPIFLRARSFAVLRQLGDAVCALVPQELPSLLHASASGLAVGEPLVVRASACRTLCRFLTAVEDPALHETLLLQSGVLASIGSLLQDADDDLLHLTLESLCVIIRTCPRAIVSVEGSLSSIVLEIWRRCAADPLVHLQLQDVVGIAAAADPVLQRSMEEKLLPAVAEDLNQHAEVHQAAAAVDLYGVLLKRANVPFSKDLCSCMEAMLLMVVRSRDSGLLQNSCDVLCIAIRRSPEQLANIGLLGAIMQSIERLLGPDLDDDACLFVGPVITLLLSRFGSQLPADLVKGLLSALAARLARATRPYLQQELIVVFARLLMDDFEVVLTLLSNLQVPIPNCGPAEYCGGLELLLSTWLISASEIRARRARNVTVSALCRLHEHSLNDSSLQLLQLRSHVGESLPKGLFTAIVAALEFENHRCSKLKESRARKQSNDSEEDDEAFQNEGINQNQDTPNNDSSCRMSLLDLVDEEDDDDNDSMHEDEGECDTFRDLEYSDPFHNLDLRTAVTEYLTRHAASVPSQTELGMRLQAALAEVHANP